MREQHGLSIVELLIVLVILGIMVGIGVVTFRSDRIAVNQAAQVLTSNITRTRFEALKANQSAGIRLFTDGSGSYDICVDTNDSNACDADEVLNTITFGQGDWGQVQLSATTIATIVFDRRGVPINPAPGTITLSNQAGTYTRTIQVSAAGKADLL